MGHASRARAAALFACLGLLTVEARASVSRAVRFADLVRAARAADLVTPTEQHAVWENGRIYTYTRVRVDRAIAGDLGAGADAWVRTMGGRVGDVGQIVDGEAALAVGQPTLLFLQAGPTGAYEVTARAQGQFALVRPTGDAGAVRLAQSGAVGVLVASTKPWRTYQPGSAFLTLSSQRDAFAADVLHDRPLEDAIVDVASAWSATHAR